MCVYVRDSLNMLLRPSLDLFQNFSTFYNSRHHVLVRPTIIHNVSQIFYKMKQNFLGGNKKEKKPCYSSTQKNKKKKEAKTMCLV